MATEIGAVSTTGKTVYAVLRNSAAQVYRTDTHVFENETDANYALYAIAMSEQGTSGVYFGTMPNTAAGGVLGDYNYLARLQLGGTPALGDPAIGTRDFSWSGAAVITVGSADADVLTRLATSGYTAPDNAGIATAAAAAASAAVTAAAIKAKTDQLTFTGSSLDSYVTNIPAGGIVVQVTGLTVNGVLSNQATVQNMALVRGTDAQWVFTFLNADGTATNLAGIAAQLLVKRLISDGDGAALITLSTANGRLTIPTPASGVLYANFVAADTAESPHTRFPDNSFQIYGLKVWNLGGQQVPKALGSLEVVNFPVIGTTAP